jgi:hypothetical protein
MRAHLTLPARMCDTQSIANQKGYQTLDTWSAGSHSSSWYIMAYSLKYNKKKKKKTTHSHFFSLNYQLSRYHVAQGLRHTKTLLSKSYSQEQAESQPNWEQIFLGDKETPACWVKSLLHRFPLRLKISLDFWFLLLNQTWKNYRKQSIS